MASIPVFAESQGTDDLKPFTYISDPAGVQAQAGSKGVSAGAAAGPATGTQAKTSYSKGMAVFVHVRGGLMYEAAIGGQKFNFKPEKTE